MRPINIIIVIMLLVSGAVGAETKINGSSQVDFSKVHMDVIPLNQHTGMEIVASSAWDDVWRWSSTGVLEVPENTTVKNGNHSAKVTSNGANGAFYQYIDSPSARGTKTISQYAGRTITIGGWFYVSSGNTQAPTLFINDEVSVTNSAALTKNSAWTWVTLTKTLSDSAENITIGINCSVASDLDDVIYVDDFIAVEGSTIIPPGPSGPAMGAYNVLTQNGYGQALMFQGHGYPIQFFARPGAEGYKDYNKVIWYCYLPGYTALVPAAFITAHYEHLTDGVHKHWSVETVDADGYTHQTRLLVEYGEDAPDITMGNIAVLKVKAPLNLSATDATSYVTSLRSTSSGGNTYHFISPITETDTDDAYVGYFRDTNTAGASYLRCYQGDGTSTVTFTINATAGDITTIRRIYFAPTDYIDYDASNNQFRFNIGGTCRGYVDTSGFHNGAP